MRCHWPVDEVSWKSEIVVGTMYVMPLPLSSRTSHERQTAKQTNVSRAISEACFRKAKPSYFPTRKLVFRWNTDKMLTIFSWSMLYWIVWIIYGKVALLYVACFSEQARQKHDDPSFGWKAKMCFVTAIFSYLNRLFQSVFAEILRLNTCGRYIPTCVRVLRECLCGVHARRWNIFVWKKLQYLNV